jgi:hypothetical protein
MDILPVYHQFSERNLHLLHLAFLLVQQLYGFCLVSRLIISHVVYVKIGLPSEIS